MDLIILNYWYFLYKDYNFIFKDIQYHTKVWSSLRLHLFDKKYNKNSNSLMNRSLKRTAFIWNRKQKLFYIRNLHDSKQHYCPSVLYMKLVSTLHFLSKHKKMLHGVVTAAVWSPFMLKWLDCWKMVHLMYGWLKWMQQKRKNLPMSLAWVVFPHLNSSKMATGKMSQIFLVMYLFV